MKKMILIFLIAFSLFASAEQNATQENLNKAESTEETKFIICAKSMRFVNAKDAFYIYGGNTYGTMKKNFGFLYEADAKEYVKKNGGRVVNYETYIELTTKTSE